MVQSKDIVFIPMATVSFVVNATVLTVLIRYKTLRSNTTNKLLINLLACYSLCDVITCIGCVTHMETWQFSVATAVASVLALTMLTIDRMLVIALPYRYENLPKRVPYLLIVITWLIPSLYYVLSKVFNKQRKNTMYVLSVVVIGCISLVATNTIVFLNARKQLKKICKTSVCTAPKSCDSDTKTTPRPVFCKKQAKLAESCFGVVIIYVVCWFPLLMEKFLVSMDMREVSRAVFVTTRGFVFASSIITPAFYAWHNRNIKRQLKLCCKLTSSAKEDGLAQHCTHDAQSKRSKSSKNSSGVTMITAI